MKKIKDIKLPKHLQHLNRETLIEIIIIQRKILTLQKEMVIILDKHTNKLFKSMDRFQTKSINIIKEYNKQ